MRVGERLRLEALSRVDHEDGALAGRERARDLVAEIDVAGRVDQVELVELALVRPGHAHRLGLDRDAALALEIHRVEHLLAHLALRDRARELQDAIGQRRLAVVDVRDDREVANAGLLHASHLGTPSGSEPELDAQSGRTAMHRSNPVPAAGGCAEARGRCGTPRFPSPSRPARRRRPSRPDRPPA